LAIEMSSDLNYTELFKSFIQVIQKPNQPNMQIKMAINFIYGQSKDGKRCQELFTDDYLKQLLELLTSRNDLSKETYETLVEIVSNYLEHDFSKPLDEYWLKRLKKNF
jgi:hypothetical protein